MKNPVEQLKTRRKEKDYVRHSLGERGEAYPPSTQPGEMSL